MNDSLTARESYDVLVVGGGAAGMMAACKTAEAGARVLLCERNDTCGKKLRITGKGRCNLTNDCDVESFLNAVPRGGRFLRSALARFTPLDCVRYFESLGVPTCTERGQRVFPVSGKASDVAEALERELSRLHVKRLRMRVTGLLTEDNHVTGVRDSEGRCVGASAVVLATGGLSYPKTGSDGDGYRLAESVGHSLTPRTPSLVPLCASENDCGRMQGLSLRNVSLRLVEGMGGKTLWSDGPGELLFTHFGISGPLCLSASAYWQAGQHVEIDLKPGLDEEQLDARLLRDFDLYAARRFRNALGDLLPGRMIPVVVERSGIDPDKRAGELCRPERKRLGVLLKAFPVAISGTRSIAEAVVTRGGVNTAEINPKTMESKCCGGLFIVGELLDADALTGGYNLHIAWATGRAVTVADTGARQN